MSGRPIRTNIVLGAVTLGLGAILCTVPTAARADQPVAGQSTVSEQSIVSERPAGVQPVSKRAARIQATSSPVKGDRPGQMVKAVSPLTKVTGHLAHSTRSGEARPGLATEVVLRSLSMLGIDYKWGGNTPETGLDCSGLVRYVYHELLDRTLPRRSVEISREGESVSRQSLQPGDLVFFNTLRRAFSHVGIYIGNNQFVHAPSKGKQVRVSSLDNRYWSTRFNGGRRLLDNPDPARSLAFDRPRGKLDEL
ncbi:MAG: C40 family peptidase [Burkholderiaceae bacterium]